MLLSLAIWVPIAAGLLVLAAGDDRRASLQRTLALAGAVLDVFDPEPLPKDSPLWGVPNLIVSPHAGVDDGSVYVDRGLDIFADNLKRYLSGRKLRNVIDYDAGY